jgi:hypothetical protein
MLAAVMALAGVAVGVMSCLFVSTAIDRSRERRRTQRRATEAKQACYQRTLMALDELLVMRPDHPDLGMALRTVTAHITELRLIAPTAVAELADMCVQATLQGAGDPTQAAQLRAHFIETVRGDLVGDSVPSRPPALPARREAQHPGRHAKPRRA